MHCVKRFVGQWSDSFLYNTRCVCVPSMAHPFFSDVPGNIRIPGERRISCIQSFFISFYILFFFFNSLCSYILLFSYFFLHSSCFVFSIAVLLCMNISVTVMQVWNSKGLKHKICEPVVWLIEFFRKFSDVFNSCVITKGINPDVPPYWKNIERGPRVNKM